jgi:hypothetical protein
MTCLSRFGLLMRRSWKGRLAFSLVLSMASGAALAGIPLAAQCQSLGLYSFHSRPNIPRVRRWLDELSVPAAGHWSQRCNPGWLDPPRRSLPNAVSDPGRYRPFRRDGRGECERNYDTEEHHWN